jgi:hypothetical protein
MPPVEGETLPLASARGALSLIVGRFWGPAGLCVWAVLEGIDDVWRLVGVWTTILESSDRSLVKVRRLNRGQSQR